MQLLLFLSSTPSLPPVLGVPLLRALGWQGAHRGLGPTASMVYSKIPPAARQLLSLMPGTSAPTGYQHLYWSKTHHKAIYRSEGAAGIKDTCVFLARHKVQIAWQRWWWWPEYLLNFYPTTYPRAERKLNLSPFLAFFISMFRRKAVPGAQGTRGPSSHQVILHSMVPSDLSLPDFYFLPCHMPHLSSVSTGPAPCLNRRREEGKAERNKEVCSSSKASKQYHFYLPQLIFIPFLPFSPLFIQSQPHDLTSTTT